MELNRNRVTTEVAFVINIRPRECENLTYSQDCFENHLASNECIRKEREFQLPGISVQMLHWLSVGSHECSSKNRVPFQLQQLRFRGCCAS